MRDVNVREKNNTEGNIGTFDEIISNNDDEKWGDLFHTIF
jgi:hypothetical protein